jgi:hypothetical protein
MARKPLVGGLGVSLVAAVVVGASLASASSGSGARVWGVPASMVHFSKGVHAANATGATLTLISRNAHETHVDEPPSGFSQGDETTVSSPLFNAGGTRVGHLDVHGAFTGVFPKSHTARLQVTFTATLAHGAITATGVASASETSNGFTAAVTGGTGAYRRTDGWVRVTFTSETTVTLAYHLTD